MSYIDPRLLPAIESAAVVGPTRESVGRYSNSDAGKLGTRNGAWDIHQRHIFSDSTLAALDSLLPTCSRGHFLQGLSAANPGFSSSVASVSPLYRTVLYSVANGFAGLVESSVEEAIRFLQHETSHQLYQFIRDTSGFCSRAIAQNLFKGSIEVGDAQVVSWLLQEQAVKIDPNEQICSAGRERYTPLERASNLRHKGVIDTLLRHNADVHKTYDNRHRRGALDHAIYTYEKYEKYTRLDPDIFKMLLGAGGGVTHHSMLHLIINREDEFVHLLIEKHTSKNHEEWSRWGIYRDSFKFLHEGVCMRIIKIMVDGGANFNYHVEVPTPYGKYLKTIIDVAAERGSLEMVNTLHCAVASGNVILVNFPHEQRRAA